MLTAHLHPARAGDHPRVPLAPPFERRTVGGLGQVVQRHRQGAGPHESGQALGGVQRVATEDAVGEMQVDRPWGQGPVLDVYQGGPPGTPT